MDFEAWRRHFERGRTRTLPRIDDTREIPPALRPALADSLARFALGETGEGRIVEDVRRCAPRWGLPPDYVHALRDFVAEEGRHAAILRAAVRALGGRPRRHAWTATAFAKVRRIGGPRAELAVLLGAEVAALAIYGAFVQRIADGPLRDALAEIARDEGTHLLFHVDLMRALAPDRRRRAAIAHAWAVLGLAAGLVVAVDHRRTLRALGSGPLAVVRRALEIVGFTVRSLEHPAPASPTEPDPGAEDAHPVPPIRAPDASMDRVGATTLA